MAIGSRGYVGGNFGIELDGHANAGWLWSAEGGMATTEVIQEKTGPDAIQHKHISGLKYEDISIVFGTGMSEEFWEWVQSSFSKRNYERRSGAIVAANFNLRESSRLEFYDALVTELGLPALDATSKEPAKVTCKITPELTRMKLAGGKEMVGGSQNRGVQRKWHRSDFRLRVDGLNEQGTMRVNQVEAITLKQKLQPFQVGELRDYQIEPTQIEYPNLVISVPESHAGPWLDWHEDFVVKGRCDPQHEKNGVIEYLSPNLQETLITVKFMGLGIFKITPDKLDAGSEKIRSMKIEMYCETVDFSYGKAATWA